MADTPVTEIFLLLLWDADVVEHWTQPCGLGKHQWTDVSAACKQQTSGVATCQGRF